MTIAAAVPKKSSSAHIRELEAEQTQIRGQIAKIQKQLKDLERYHDPDSLLYLTFKTATKIEDLCAPVVPLRQALRDDIRKLREQAKAVQAELQAAKPKQRRPPVKPGATPVPHGTVQGGSAAAATAAKPSAAPPPSKPPVVKPDPELERQADVAEQSIGMALDILKANPSLDAIHDVVETMTPISRAGRDTQREWAAIQDAGEQLQDQGIKAVNASPSFDNIHDLLEVMQALQLIGGDTQRGFEAIQVAQGKRVNFAVSILNSDCTSHNVAMVLMATKEAALVGNEAASEAGIKAAADATVKLRKASERQFRNDPTTANFQAFMHAMQEESLMGNDGTPLENPPGLPFVRPGILHTVKQGETLQAISRLYFGSPGWWDVIVFRNFEKFRGLPDPTKILPGTLLKIS
jgi:hypothetical protein